MVEREQHASALERAESLEAELRAAVESREQAQQELREVQETLRLVWGMVRQKEQEISAAADRARGAGRHPLALAAERLTWRPGRLAG